MLNDLSVETQMELGVLLARLELAITRVVHPEQVYCAKFGEAGGNLHFHVFPRLASLTKDYLRTYPEQQNLIHGPILLDWARELYQVEPGDISAQVISCVSEIKMLMNANQALDRTQSNGK